MNDADRGPRAMFVDRIAQVAVTIGMCLMVSQVAYATRHWHITVGVAIGAVAGLVASRLSTQPDTVTLVAVVISLAVYQAALSAMVWPLPRGWATANAVGVVISQLSPLLAGVPRTTRTGMRIAATCVVIAVATSSSASAWISSARLSTPTPLQQRSNGIDVTVDTHQWLTNRAMTIVANDGFTAIAEFLASDDPTAPQRTDPQNGQTLAGTEPYSWRVLMGSRDADGVLYPQMRDHLHNFWTHRGRQWIIGRSAASNAEHAFTTATAAWRAGDRPNAMYWLGAAVHLVEDACVPQHNWFGVGYYHQDYERWVQQHHDELSIDRGGIYRDDFRVRDAHGGPGWTSSHPRGWVDECAHRSAGVMRDAMHVLPTPSTPRDPQWATAEHVADTQRLSAGFLRFFFEEVAGP